MKGYSNHMTDSKIPDTPQPRKQSPEGSSAHSSRRTRFLIRAAQRENRRHAFTDWLELLTELLEIIVAVIVLGGFVISVIPLVKDMPALLDSSNDYTFHVFLEHAFNLVIGIEFIRMLIKHTPGSALEVLLFAIARHMVLSDASSLELILGVASIAGIFAIRKYLYVHSFESGEDDTSFDWIRWAERRDTAGESENSARCSKEDNP